ncbi:MAG: hypothetical protein ACHWZW_10255 [Spirulina sp.]
MQPIRPITITASLGLGAVTLGLASILVNGPSAAAQVEPTQLSPDPTIIEFFRRDPEDRNRGRDGTSRGDGWVETAEGSEAEPSRTCILNPGRNDTLWHLQPLFLIQGRVSRMEVKEFQPFLRRRIDPPPLVLWSVAPNAVGDALVKAPFEATPLEPGTRYEWRIYQTSARAENSGLPTYILPFRVMSNGPDRDQITIDLAQLHTDLVAQGANSAAIAEAKATYFLEQDMPADALHILFSVDETDLTPALTTLQTTLIDTICSEEITS